MIKNTHFTKQINAMNDLYSKLNTQIQNVCIEQLKMIKANDLNTNQIDTLREQYQLLLKQIQYESKLRMGRVARCLEHG
jgi:hypothetical protein